jgi:hypothetical protein
MLKSLSMTASSRAVAPRVPAFMTVQAGGYTARMGRAPRQLVSRSCAVCEWEGALVETSTDAVDCPWCHAPTQIVRVELLTLVAGTKNPHAAALGRLGGKKGGRVRAERLSASRRREIARGAAEARWRRRR